MDARVPDSGARPLTGRPAVTHEGKAAQTQVRLDKWLWSARFYKTRQLAADAVKGGHIEVNGSRAKPARSVRVGDRITVTRRPYTFDIEVLALRERRVSASEARLLYQESEPSVERRATLREQLKTQAQQILYDPKKPAPRARRDARHRKRGYE